MKRDALSSFLRRVVMGVLPLAAASCCSDRRISVQTSVDAFVVDDAGIYVGEPLPPTVCESVCAGRRGVTEVYGCTVADASDGGITVVTCDEQYKKCSFLAGGRPPLGLKPRGRIVARDEIGAFFATMAHIEAAAVAGFEELAAALAAHGAPPSLVAQARRAADDERRHSRVATAFARTRGATIPPVEVAPIGSPTLEELALANATEGCVVETFGAVVAEWQAHGAADRAVRRAFANIAVDERRHAELAFALARWLEPRLDGAARARVAEARGGAVDKLARDVAQDTPPRLVSELGLPDAAAARELVARMRARLWS